MGTEASFQAIPEDCELLIRARQEQEIAENMQFFKSGGTWEPDSWGKPSPDEQYFYDAVQELIRAHPGLEKRYFYAGARTYDAIVYLLSPARREEEWGSDQSLIKKAIYGVELLHPEARATQGVPIGFVSRVDTKIIADYLDQITMEQLHEYYDPPKMYEAAVYKMGPNRDERRFQVIWNEFVGMRDVYRAAADHDEAVITVID